MNQLKRSGRASALLLVSGMALALLAGPSTSLAGPDCSGRLTPAQQATCAHSSAATTTPAQPRAQLRFISPNPNTQPPLHGTNPHGQGTVGVVHLNPDPNRPYSADPTGKPDNESIVVGRSRGEQLANGTYHGHITVAALFGNEIVGIDTTPGQSRTGPLTPLQQGLLTPLCNGSANAICLSAVTADSTTTSSGSTNHFQTASAQLGGPAGITTGIASSDGNISQNGTCQTSTGSSQVANANIGGGAPVLADLIKSSSTSIACNDGTPPTQTNTSSVINLRGGGVPIPAPGCAAGTPNTTTGIPLLLPIVCNADDTNGSSGPAQGSIPYGVREALDVFVISMSPVSTAKLSTAASESLAVAPPKGACPPGTVGFPPNCVPTPCPPGTHGQQPNCIPNACPPGTHGKQPNCVPNACPPGFVGRPPNCRPARKSCIDPNDNDCATSNPFGPRIPEGGPLDRARDCATGAENTANCPGGPGEGAEAAQNRTRGTLPFTGYDAIPIVLAGVALLGGGLALRRRLGRLS